MPKKAKETAPGYPSTLELDKMLAARDRLGTQQIGEFVEWLGEQGIVLARTHEHDDACRNDDGWLVCGYRTDGLEPVLEPLQRLLEFYADVNPAKMEQERRAILAWAANRGERSVA